MDYQLFYDQFASQYDEMTLFESRIEKEKNFFETLKNKYNFKSALDVGCGTGAHSIILSSLGIDTIGIDPSLGMIEKAKLNAKNYNNIKFYQETLEQHSERNQNKYDAIFFMGNGLAHITEKTKLNNFINSLKNMLSENSIFVFQILNYDKIFIEKEKIINIRDVKDKLYIRFYDFLDNNKINFNILIIQKENSNILKHKLISTSLYGYTYSEILKLFTEFGFEILNEYGDLNMNDYTIKNSQNLILVLRTIN